MVENAEDVVAIMNGVRGGLLEPGGVGYAPGGGGETEDRALREARLKLAELLSPAPALVDELLRVLQLSPAVVQTALLELELAGRLERLPGGRVALIVHEDGGDA